MHTQKDNEKRRMGKWGQKYKRPDVDGWNTRPVMRTPEERNKLVMANTKMVWDRCLQAFHKQPSLKSRFGEIEDLVQEMLLVLMRAGDIWDPNNPNEASFHTYAYRCITKRLSDLGICEGLIRLPNNAKVKNNADQLPTFHVEQFPWEDGSKGPLTFEDEFEPLAKDYSSDQDYIYSDENGDYVYKALVKVPARYRKLVIMRYGLNGKPPMTYERIGRKCGMSKQRAKQIVKVGEEIMQSCFKKWGLEHEDFFG